MNFSLKIPKKLRGDVPRNVYIIAANKVVYSPEIGGKPAKKEKAMPENVFYFFKNWFSSY